MKRSLAALSLIGLVVGGPARERPPWLILDGETMRCVAAAPLAGRRGLPLASPRDLIRGLAGTGVSTEATSDRLSDGRLVVVTVRATMAGRRARIMYFRSLPMCIMVATAIRDQARLGK